MVVDLKLELMVIGFITWSLYTVISGMVRG